LGDFKKKEQKKKKKYTDKKVKKKITHQKENYKAWIPHSIQKTMR